MPNTVCIYPQVKAKQAQDTQPESGVWGKILPLTAVMLVACTFLFGNLGSFPLFNPDEALYAEPAREMLEIGDYITTYLNYVVRFTKPPLAIWGRRSAYWHLAATSLRCAFLEPRPEQF